MARKVYPAYTLTLDAITGGGQSIGTLEDGRKCFVWGGLPGELVSIQSTKIKSSLVEGVVTEVLTSSPERIKPQDPESYLSTSPWQILTFEAEQKYKAQLIYDAFALHNIRLPQPPNVYSNDNIYGYRNKIEFSWFSQTDPTSGVDTLDLAFFRRGSKGKIVVNGTSLAHPSINRLAREIRDLLHQKSISARQLKTLLIRSDKSGNCVWQLYTKDKLPDTITEQEADKLSAQGGEIIYSDPRSPASRITERLASFGDITLRDNLLGTTFRYATESFFQINLPVYSQVLSDIRKFIPSEKPVIDLYSGVGTIGLTVTSKDQPLKLIEINSSAVDEMKHNISDLGRKNTEAILSASENVTDQIEPNSTIIVDPPRAGLHQDVTMRLLETAPKRIIYLSCNPVTQARDIQLLSEKYDISHMQGYNFFPRTPHIENLVILDLKFSSSSLS